MVDLDNATITFTEESPVDSSLSKTWSVSFQSGKLVRVVQVPGTSNAKWDEYLCGDKGFPIIFSRDGETLFVSFAAGLGQDFTAPNRLAFLACAAAGRDLPTEFRKTESDVDTLLLEPQDPAHPSLVTFGHREQFAREDHTLAHGQRNLSGWGIVPEYVELSTEDPIGVAWNEDYSSGRTLRLVSVGETSGQELGITHALTQGCKEVAANYGCFFLPTNKSQIDNALKNGFPSTFSEWKKFEKTGFDMSGV